MLKQDYLCTLFKNGYIYIQENACYDETDNTDLVSIVLKTFDSLGYSLDCETIKVLCKLTKSSLTYFYKNYGFMCLDNFIVDKWPFHNKWPTIKSTATLSKYTKMIKDCMNDTYAPQKEVLHLINKQEALVFLHNAFTKYFSTNELFDDSFIKTFYKEFKDTVIINSIYNFDKCKTYFELTKPKRKYDIELLLNDKVLSFVKKPDDILSVYILISDFDADSFSGVTHLKSLKRSTRRLLLSYLDDLAKDENIYTELRKNGKLWKELFKQLHVGEYSSKFPHIFEVAKNFRNNTYDTFGKKINKLKNNPSAYINLLKTKPEMYVKQLHSLLSNNNFDNKEVLSAFKEVSYNIKTKDLIFLFEFFKNDGFFKTRVVKRYYNFHYDNSYHFLEIFETRKPLESSIIKEIIEIIETTLKERFSAFDNLGKVYIDDCCKDYPVSIYNKFIDSSIKTLPYRSKIKIGDTTQGNILRIFTCAKFNTYKSSINSKAYFFTNDFKFKYAISKGSKKNGKYLQCSYNSFENDDESYEYFDFDYKKASKYMKYLVLRVSLYSDTSFTDNKFVGCGAKICNGTCENDINVLINDAIQLASNNGREVLSFAIDLDTLELVWIDKFINFTVQYIDHSFLANFSCRLIDCLRQSMNLKDFLMLHSNRMVLVDKKEEADFIISNTEDANLKVWDVNEIERNWL